MAQDLVDTVDTGQADFHSQAFENSYLELEPGDSDLDILAKLDKILRDADLSAAI